MNWEKTIVRRTMEGAADNPGVQLHFLLQRLETCPEALPAIAGAVEDMAHWHDQQSEALRAEIRRRNGGAEIVELKK